MSAALSDREWQVLGHLCCGKTNAQIGDALLADTPDYLPIVETTVKGHLKSIYRKLIEMGVVERKANMRTVACVWLYRLSESGYRPKHSAYVVILPRTRILRASDV